MTAEYDAIAAQYKKSKLHPWRLHVERHVLLGLLGDLRGRSVLDLACGEGFYTRQLRQLGAARVVGVDLSERMIELARAQESREPLGITYLVQDVAQLQLGETFDVVLAAYLLNYAKSREELATLCRSVAGALKPGGRFVAVNDNAEQPADAYPKMRKYGFIKSVTGPLREGTPITYTMYVDSGPFQFDNFYLPRSAYDEALHAAGFRDVRWHGPQVDAAGEREFGREFWADLLEQPPVMFLECTRT